MDNNSENQVEDKELSEVIKPFKLNPLPFDGLDLSGFISKIPARGEELE